MNYDELYSNIIKIAFIVMIVLYSLGMMYDYYFIEKHPITWNNLTKFIVIWINPSFIVAFSTMLYVMITYGLFITSKKQIEAIHRQISEGKRPNLVVKLEPFGISATALKIQNVGRGNAHDISVDFEVKKEGKSIMKKKWVHTLLQPTEHVRLVPFLNKSYKKILEEYDEFEFETACNGDDQSRVKSPKTILNLKKFLEYMQGDMWILETTTEEDIHNIAEELKEIRTKIDSIKNKYLQRR
ncbi:hypothetical protein HYX15_01620 [Candidatus Woesearchaeota archaeon]|nr:hypothetical protein [Candidatus Woesearchaeota archaeon]